MNGWPSRNAAGAGPNAAAPLRHPGTEDPPSRCVTWRASGATKRSAREGGRENGART